MLNKMFGKKKTAKDMAREWKRNIRKETRDLDKQIRMLGAEERKITKSMKEAAKRKDMDIVKTLAGTLVQARKAKGRLYTAKSQMNSVSMQIGEQQAQLKMMKAFQQSNSAMKMMNNLCSMKEVTGAMRSMAKEMHKAGFIEDMVNDVIEDEADDVAVDDAIAGVLQETLGDKLSQVVIGSEKLPEGQKKKVDEPAEEEEEDELNSRLAALKSI